jgi:hypothetical protein
MKMKRFLLTTSILLILTHSFSQMKKSVFDQSKDALNAGQNDKALSLAKQALKESQGKDFNVFILAAECAAATGDNQLTIIYLNNAVSAGLCSYESIRRIPQFDKLLNTKEWKMLVGKITLNRNEKEKHLIDVSNENFTENNFNNFIAGLKNKNASDAYTAIRNYNLFSQPLNKGTTYLFKISTSQYGAVPFKVYVPQIIHPRTGTRSSCIFMEHQVFIHSLWQRKII